MSHSYQTYFGFPGLDLNFDYRLRDHMIMRFASVGNLVEGEALVIKHVLNKQIKEDDVDQQRENIFHTRCHIQNKVCRMMEVVMLM